MFYYIRRSVLTLIWLVVAIVLLVSLISYSANDPSWSHFSNNHTDTVSNLAGESGAWLADMLYTFLGASSWWLIIIACYEAWRVWYTKTQPMIVLRVLGYLFLIIATAGLTALITTSWLARGIIGQVVGLGLSDLLSTIGAILFLLIFVVITFGFTFNLQRFFLDKTLSLSEDEDTDNEQETQAESKTKPDPDTQANEPNEEEVIAQVIPATQQLDLPIGYEAMEDADYDPAQASRFNQFLDETGFSEAKEYEWLKDEADIANNPFRPISSAHLANVKLTKKLDNKLQREVIPSSQMHADNTLSNIPQSAFYDQQTNPNHANENEAYYGREINHYPEDNSIKHTEFGMDFASFKLHVPTPKHEPQQIIEPVATKSAMPTTVVEPDRSGISEFSVSDLPSDKPVERKPTSWQTQSQDFDEKHSVTEILGMRKSALKISPEISDNQSHSPLTTTERSVEIDELKPVTVETQSLDIHDDALFAGKSRAMQTAKHRANLSPLPSYDLLDLPDPNRSPSYSREELQQLSELLEIKLQEFNIKANVVNAQLGPVVTRFEVDLAPGVKASKVTGIAKDLARSLSMASVRVVEVIPGKPYIGIEVPNPNRQMVRLIELIQTDTFKDPKGMISMAMGKDIAGRPVIADLAKAPHMLVAGTTGSGKSVLVNSLLLSMLLKYTPQQLRLILIDPKQLELANYGDIPHLLTPVVTDMNEAASSLAWCVAEMERRYQLMSLFKVRKLDEFNKKVIEAEKNGQPLLDPLWRQNDSVSQDKPPKLKALPQIVIVADEFADMIMQVGKQAEELITRLAQKSRAAGIHLILATQRPSVDVITGLIKANIPVRAALRVNSKVDSRTILDAGGAEDMLGHGDMLFLGPGQNEPNRVHGAFISDEEVNRVCDAWRERGAPDYIDNMFDNFSLTSPSNGGNESSGISTGDEDVLYDEVVAFVLETRKVSASSIQRKFSIGYNRAARIVDAMEEAGLVSAMGKSGKRELLV